MQQQWGLSQSVAKVANFKAIVHVIVLCGSCSSEDMKMANLQLSKICGLCRISVQKFGTSKTLKSSCR